MWALQVKHPSKGSKYEVLKNRIYDLWELKKAKKYPRCAHEW
jgi:hypothetical protein